MSKINWDVYARRRRINLSKLIETQGIESYSDYLMFCQTVNVNPMPESDFPLSDTKPAPAVEKKQPVPVKKTAPKKTTLEMLSEDRSGEYLKVVKEAEETSDDSGNRWGIKKTNGSTKKTTKKTSK